MLQESLLHKQSSRIKVYHILVKDWGDARQTDFCLTDSNHRTVDRHCDRLSPRSEKEPVGDWYKVRDNKTQERPYKIIKLTLTLPISRPIGHYT